MGTRNLTCVYIDGQYKVAQYGQWDGYPSGQGINLLNILKGLNLEKLREAARKCRFLTKDEINELADDEKWLEKYPQLSRDHGANIVKLVYENNGLTLHNQIKFAADSLFCEWAYVVDLDKNLLEVYKGFNKEPSITAEDRFFFLNEEYDDNGYYPIKIIATFDLNHLPDDKQFIDHFKISEDE